VTVLSTPTVGTPPSRPSGADGGPYAVLARLAAGREERLVGVRELPARPAQELDWPPWVPDLLRERFVASGISRPWAHQIDAADHARAGHDVVVATGSGSGKSLAYLLPALAAALDPAGAAGSTGAEGSAVSTNAAVTVRSTGADRATGQLPTRRIRRASTLYLAPTKALAADQARALAELAIPGLGVSVVDGDTAPAERTWARDHARIVLTNPDMLHHVLLPDHDRWGAFWGSLRYVVLDECHAYRGLFAAHVAQLLRRSRRVAHAHGADPVAILASATLAEPQVLAAGLTGRPVVAVTEDGAPRGARVLGLWEPPTDERGVRRSLVAETATLLADLVAAGRQTVAFVRSRRTAELVALGARERLADAGLDSDAVAAYRAGYLVEDRRALERAIRERRILGLAATNALELGVDISGLDAVLTAGFPGTRASWWQQAGRTGRAGSPGLALFVAREDPLDTYLVRHPAALLDAPVEAGVVDPGNPCVLAPQLCAAASELPLRENELALFAGGSVAADDTRAVRRTVDDLTAAGLLRRRPGGWFWTRSGRAGDLADLRGAGGRPAALVEVGSGRLLGTIDQASASSQAHPGAIYLHAGRSWIVGEWLTDDAGRPVTIACEAVVPEWTTAPRSHSTVALLDVSDQTRLASADLYRGTVEVTSQVHSFVRRRVGSGIVIDETELSLPAQQLETRAVWWTLPDDAIEAAGVTRADLAGALHGAEHTAIGLLPLFATCDRADIGGLSTALHPDTGLATVIVHDGVPGGAGYAARGFDVADQWWAATAQTLADCACSDGCPSCVQSPKCGTGNAPLSKDGARRLLTALR
jgi:DEAD/DEAH box helicase domain-containing protein